MQSWAASAMNEGTIDVSPSTYLPNYGTEPMPASPALIEAPTAPVTKTKATKKRKAAPEPLPAQDVPTTTASSSLLYDGQQPSVFASYLQSASTSQLSPALTAPTSVTSPVEAPAESPETPSSAPSGGKGTVKDTKRAAQNRQAQRAFRERKEKHIKGLEERAQLYDQLMSQESSMSARWLELAEREKMVLERETLLQGSSGGGGSTEAAQLIQNYNTRIHNLQIELQVARETSSVLQQPKPLTDLQISLTQTQIALRDREQRLDNLRRSLEEVSIESARLRKENEELKAQLAAASASAPAAAP